MGYLTDQANIEVVYAGGTISSLATPEGYREGGYVVDLVGKLEEKIPNFTKGFHIGQTRVAYTGLSENIGENSLKNIEEATREALYRDPQAVVITHGTDSMEQTARHLQHTLIDTLEKKRAKVILTGANEDLSHPKTDAWDNLTFALESAKEDVKPGVYVAFHNRLIPANLVVKEPFNDVEMNYASKEDKEYLEKVQRLEREDEKTISRLKEVLGESKEEESAIEFAVNKISLHEEKLIEKINEGQVKAVLLKLYHSGTADTEAPGTEIDDLVRKIREEKGVLFFGVTENEESAELHSYETSVKLREAGVIPLYNMHETAALIKLKLLASKHTGTELIDEMLRNRVGEIDESKIIESDIAKLKELYGQR